MSDLFPSAPPRRLRLRGDALRRAGDLATWFVLPAALLALWQVGSARGWWPELFVPSPAYLWETVGILAETGELQAAVLATVTRVAWGFGVGAALGIVAGSALGLSRWGNETFGDLFAGLAQAPLVGWAPLLIILLGLQEPFRISIIAVAAFFPVAIALHQALLRVPAAWREVAALCELPRPLQLTRLYLPACLPSLITGARLGLSKSFMIVVFAELFAASAGLGHLMDNARRQFQMDAVLIGCIAIGLIGVVVDQAMAAIERRAAR